MLVVLLIGVTVSFLVSWSAYEWMPLTAYFVWLLIGMLLLRFVPLLVLTTYDAVAAIASRSGWRGRSTGARFVAISHFAVAVALVALPVEPAAQRPAGAR